MEENQLDPSMKNLLALQEMEEKNQKIEKKPCKIPQKKQEK